GWQNRLESLLTGLIHGDASGARLLLGFGLLDGQGLVNPLIGSLEVGGPRGGVFALNVGAFAVHQVHVGHGVVVIRTQLQGLVQVVDAFLDVGRILLFERRAHFLVLKRLFGFEPEFGALFHARLVGLGPVDDRHRVVGLRIVGVEFGGLAIELFRLVELLHLQVQVGDALDAIDVFGVALQHGLVLLDRLLGHLVVVGSVGAGDVLLSKRGRQV